MTDIRLHQTAAGLFDAAVVQNDIETDDGLETAVIVSLFCNRRCTADELPPEAQSREGWWGDVVESGNDEIGSKLWLLRREKITSETMQRAREYSEEALQWFVDDGIAEDISVEVERKGLYQATIHIDIRRPGEQKTRRYSYLWNTIESNNGN